MTGVHTDKGPIKCDYVVVGAGPWVNKFWNMLELPRTVSIKGRDGKMHDGVRTWKFWCLEEGTLGVDPNMHKTNDGHMPPVIHVDTDAPLYSDVDGRLLTDKLWGLYYKPDFNFGGVQGGASPYVVEGEPDEVAVDPYGPDSPDFVVGDAVHRDVVFDARALPEALRRRRSTNTRGTRSPAALAASRRTASRCSTCFRENVFVIADSNHGYKMIGVGKLVAQEICGEKSQLCSSRSAFRDTPKASFIRSPTVRFRGADR